VLTPNTPYFFTLYGKAAGENVFSSGNRKVAAATRSLNSSVEVTEAMIGGTTGEYVFGGTGVTITLSGPSATDGYIIVRRLEDLVAGTLPANIEEVFTDFYWQVQAIGLSGNALQFCIEVNHNDVWPLLNYLTFRLLRRPASGLPWEDLNAGSSYTVELDAEKIKVCGLLNFSEFVLGRDPNFTAVPTIDSQNGLFEIFPNPVSDFLIIKTLTNDSSPYHVRVIDLSGKIVWQATNITSDLHSINTESLNAGIYLIQVQHHGGIQSQKLIKY
jgi:hypothetical protein